MPKTPKNGVEFYVTGTVEVPVHFPDGKVACCWCPLFCRFEENFKRYSCRLTHEWIPDPFHMIGGQCPLQFKEEENGQPRNL